MSNGEEKEVITPESEIDEMLKALGGEPHEPSEEPEKDPEKEPKKEPDPEPKPKEKDSEPEPKEPEAKESEKKDVEPEPDEKDKTISELRDKIAELEASKKEPEKKEPEVKEPESEPEKFEPQDFTKDIDLDEISRDPDKFNEVMNSVWQRAVQETSSRIHKTLPETIREQITLVNALEKAAAKFYEDNPDLEQFRKVVQLVVEETATNNQDKPYDEVISMVAPEVRRRLKLPEPEAKDPEPEPVNKQKTNKPPDLPRKGSRSGKLQEVHEPSGLESELAEMNKAIGR